MQPDMSHPHDQALADLLAGLSDAEIDHIAELAKQANGAEPNAEPDMDADEMG